MRRRIWAYIYTWLQQKQTNFSLLKRSYPLSTKVAVRRSLYLAIVKSHLYYATEVWSPAQKSLKVKVEQVQRRATKWILSLKPGQMWYGERLLTLDMLPLAYDREVKNLVFFYKAIYGYIDIDVSNYVTFNNHPPTRHSQSADYAVLWNCGTTYAMKNSLVVLPLLAGLKIF